MRREPRPTLEQRYKPGFIWYPTLDPRTYTSTQLVTCTRCGNFFCQRPIWVGIEIVDAYGDFVRWNFVNEASTVCGACHRKASVEEPPKTQVEQDIKEERTKFRRRGGKHEAANWKEKARKVQDQILVQGPRNRYFYNKQNWLYTTNCW